MNSGTGERSRHWLVCTSRGRTRIQNERMRHVSRAVNVTVMPAGVASFHGVVDDGRVLHDRGVLDDHRLGNFSPAIVLVEGLLAARISIPAHLMSGDCLGSILLHYFLSPHFVSQIVFGPVNRPILFANLLALQSSGWSKMLRMLAVRLFLHHLSALHGRSRLDIAAI